MEHSPRLQRALDRLEAMRIDLERQIVADMERQFRDDHEVIDLVDAITDVGSAQARPRATAPTTTPPPSTATICGGDALVVWHGEMEATDSR